MTTVIRIIAGLFGNFSLLFLAPLAYLSGFSKQALMFALFGLFLILIAVWLGCARIMLEVMAIAFVVFALILYVLTLPQIRSLAGDAEAKVLNAISLEDAVKACDASELVGWELVTYARNLTADKMSAKIFHPWDSPDKAFGRGAGQLFQRTLALKEIYDKLGIPNRIVYAHLDFIKDEPKEWEKFPILGHIWIRIQMGEELRHVRPPMKDSKPSCFFAASKEGHVLPEMLYPFVQIWRVIKGLDFDLQSGQWGTDPE